MKAYHVVHWDRAHETAESRKLARLPWVAKPTKHDGLGFRQVSMQPDRNDLYAAWCLILEVAAKAPRGLRGWLVRDGKALSPVELQLMTGFEKELFEKAFKFFAQEAMGWLELAELPEERLKLAEKEESPAGSAGRPGDSPATPGASPALPLVHVVQDSTGRTGDPRGNNNGGQAGGAGPAPGVSPGGSAPKRASAGSAVAASRTQFAALTAKIKDLEQRSEELTGAERSELVKKRAALEVLKSNQEAGKF